MEVVNKEDGKERPEDAFGVDGSSGIPLQKPSKP